MRLKFLATAQSPDFYEFDAEKITARKGESFEEFDLSPLDHGDKFQGLEPDTLDLPPTQIIRDAFRDEHGELHVTLTQASPMMGNWRESEWMDAAEYVAGRVYIGELKGGVIHYKNYEVEDEQN
jgi:hypothetical protein